jgi:hypothetical protein
MDEAERFVRDYAHAIQGIGPTSSVYQKSDTKLAGAAGSVPSEVTPVLRLFDGRRTLTDIIDESPFRVFDTIRILTRLVDVGVLTRRKPAGAGPAPTPPLQKFWETARIESTQDGVAPAPPTTKPVSARVGQINNRIGELNRRQGQRRALAETPVLGTPIFDTNAAQTSTSGATGNAAAAASPAPAPEASKARISGTLDLRGTADRREGRPDRRARPSVSIDAALAETSGDISDPGFGSEAKLQANEEAPVESLPQPVAPPAASASAKAGPSRAGASPAPVVSPTTSQETAASGSTPAASGSASAAAKRDDSAPSARVTGTLSITPSQRSAAAKTLDKGASVELDPVLMAELGRLEKATTPMGPPESDQPLRAEPAPTASPGPPGATSAAPGAKAPTSSPPKTGHAARITGTLSVAPSSRSSAYARKTPETEISVAVDPAFMAEAKDLDGHKPHSTPASAHGSAGAAAPANAAQGGAPGKARGKNSQGAAPAEAQRTSPSPDDSGASPSSKQSGRISSAFNAIERDFFAREADLYKPETEDNFADLDEPAGRGAAKGSPGRGPSKRRA